MRDALEDDGEAKFEKTQN